MRHSIIEGQVVYFEKESEILAGNPLGDPTKRHLPVYLPPGYNDDDQQSRRYPVIWMLAPFTSWGERLLNLQAWDENVVERMERLLATDEAQPAILVFPDCFTSYGGSQYVNSAAVGRYEDYLVEELVPFIDSILRTIAEPAHRGVMGYSSGGYGALMLTMKHPDLFGAAASHSGDMFFETCYWPDIPAAIRVFEKFSGVADFLASLNDIDRPRDKGRDWFSGLSMCAMSACYSPNPDSPLGFDLPFDIVTGEIDKDIWARWQSMDPVHAVEDHLTALKGLQALYFDCGLRDEFNLFLGARRLNRLLEAHSVQHTYIEHDSGHSNLNWRYDTSLPLMTQALALNKD